MAAGGAQAQGPRAASPFELDGYPGPAEEGLFRLYRDFSFERYVEIPRDGIVRLSGPSGTQERVTVVCSPIAQVTYVTCVQVTPSASITRAVVVAAGEARRAALASLGHRRRRSGPAADGGFEDCDSELTACLDRGMAPAWCWLDFYWCCVVDCPGGGGPAGGPG
jgi:hypothetical protein